MKVIGLCGAAMALAMTVPSARAADGCTAYDAQAAAIQPDVTTAFALMQKRDIPAATAMLPKLEALLAQLPATAPAPQRCKTDVLVYDHHQYLRFTTLQAAGKPVPSFPKGTHFVEKHLPFVELSYAVGWLKYENKDFAGAKLAYAKGLAVGPGDHDLTSEYVATLLNQEDYASIPPFIDKFLAGDADMDNAARSKLVAAKAISQAGAGNRAAAKVTIQQALQLDPNNKDAISINAQLK
jgi:tetratricopeptide (TPR) repeat protein